MDFEQTTREPTDGRLVMTDFYALEDLTGTRFNWNVFPVTRSEDAESTLPIGSLFTPLASTTNDSANLVSCIGCKGIINEFCLLDEPAAVWTCSLCRVRNPYQAQHNVTLPLGPVQQYELGRDHSPLMFVFIIDLLMDPDELTALKQQLTSTLDTLSSTNFTAALVLFDRDVKVCEPTSPLLDKGLVLHGSEDHTETDIAQTLRVEGFSSRPYAPYAVTEYFTNNTARLQQIIGGLQPARTPSPTGTSTKERPLRSTGLAIQTSTVILRNTFESHRGHAFLFTDGPCTLGQGRVVELDKSQQIRSFSDIRRNKAKLVGSKKFYDSLSKDCVSKSKGKISISMFICGYDQVGLFEMRSLSERTGGIALLVDSYEMNIFKRSFERLFEVGETGFIHLNCGEIVINTSKRLEVAGFIGPGTVKRNSNDNDNVSDNPIGHGLGNSLQLGMLNQYQTFGIYLRVNTVAYSAERKSMPKEMIIQFKTRYTSSDGVSRLKVVTVKKDTTNKTKMDSSFDQEAAVVLTARKVIHDITHDKLDHSDINDHFQEETVRLLKKFAIYVPQEPSSFTLNQSFELLPQFIYNLKRSPMMTNFNTTPDESTFYTSLFNRADLSDSLLMIQPHLTSFKDSTSTSVLLDTSSLDPNAILLMDSFFHVVIHIGDNLIDDPSKELKLQPAVDEAIELCSTRFPLPRYVVANEGSSQARFLKSRLNPSSNGNGVHTEQGTLAQFYKELVKAVVKR